MCTPRWVVYCPWTPLICHDSPFGVLSTASLFPGARLVAVQQTPCFAHHLRPKRLNLRHETCQITSLTSQSHVSRWFQIFLNLVSLMEISISTNLHPSVLSSRLGFGTNPLDQSRVPRLESAENWRHLQKIPLRSCMKLYDLHDAEVVLPKFQSQHGVA